MNIRATLGMAVAATCVAGAAIADSFPERPINMIAPFNAGGGTDLLLRGLAPHFEEAIGGDVFVSNMAGGSGTVAASALQGQRPDGYQLGYFSITVSTIQPQIKNVPYGVDSWTPICSVAASPTMLIVPNDSPFQTMEEAVAAIEGAPGEYVFGSSGPGAMTHLTTVAAFAGMGVLDKIRHLPFQGSGPAVKELTAGTIQFFGDTEILLSRGDFRPLMVFNDERLEGYPDTPTASEVGIEPPLNELYLWGGLFAPAGVPEETVAALAEACETAVGSDGFKEFAANSGTVINHRGPEEFDAFFRAQYEANGALIEAAGL
ncbi:exported protein [Jannaschia pagri]|uniref:Exported protein n=1 Tax=Jannaschia pagri TaxID=2829797 RepID=A0ABQ4NIP5_9RHOB|nr:MULTISPECIES: tripartite tricarboxylate transporter substrate binding protein [unclassified Jannaschia]GIT89611.1 exported protein [Jannaschia sp. AI_61]GIT94281.1 exported protein [Jannaschia sp. AI_62]